MSSTSEPATRLNLRHLRAGDDLAKDRAAVRPGPVGSTSALRRSLETAVGDAGRDGGIVMAFDARLLLLSLSQWEQPEFPEVPDVSAAITSRCRELEADLVFHADSQGLTGFAFGFKRRDDGDRLVSDLMIALRRPFEVDGDLAHFDVRIGTATLGSDTTTAVALEDAARLALRSADASTPHRMFSARIRTGRERTDRLTADLDQALAEDQLEVVYQPLLDMADRRWSGIEAFLRWNHPELGTLAAPDFLRLAESSERIYAIGEFVLARAFETADRLAADGIIDAPTLWVNVTAAELLAPDFKSTVRNLVAGSPSVALGLELRQGSMLADKPVCDVIRALALDDVRAAVDGFTGDLSTLRRLNRLPYDTVKLDHELIDGIDSDADTHDMVELMAKVSTRRGLTVVATCVERDEQLELLEAMDVATAQGHLIGGPVAGDELEAAMSGSPVIEAAGGVG